MADLEATFLLPFFWTSHPETGKDNTNPTGAAINTPPLAPSESFRFCWMVGMREAQLEPQSPDRKKRDPVAILLSRFPFNVTIQLLFRIYTHLTLFLNAQS